MFKNPFSFEGRIRRMEYGVTFIIYIVLYLLQMTFMYGGANAGALIGLALFIPMLWFVWAQGAKRCHDIGQSGWWQLVPFFFFVLLFRDGEPGRNLYGPNPKGVPGPEGQEFDLAGSETLDGHLRK